MWRNLAQLVQYRTLIQSLVARDLKARYRGSVLGLFWSFVNPLLLLTIYSVVFSTLLVSRDPNLTPYPVFLFCGLLPWTWFATALNESTVSLVNGGNLIRKVLFPAEVLPIVSVLSTMVHFFFGLTILVVFQIYYRHPPDAAGLIWFPVVVAIQLVLTIGLALFLSSLTVHFRDVRDLVSNLLTFWFFATPIIYSYQFEVVERYRWLFRLNPFYHLAVAYQEILFFPGPFDRVRSVLFVGALAVLVFLGGYWIFDRLRDSFAEAV
jgi:ABC-type polysaccharide/polyol phosphate export permease